MQTDEELYRMVFDQWALKMKEILATHSKLKAKHQQTFSKPFITGDEFGKMLWVQINFIEEMLLESMREKDMLVQSLFLILTAWEQHHEQPAMKDVSNQFADQVIKPLIRTNRADDVIKEAVDKMRKYLVVRSLQNR